MTGTQDADSNAESVLVNLSASGGDYAGVSTGLNVKVLDDEAVGLTLSSRTLSVTEGRTGTFTVRLNIQPSAAVALSLMSSNAEAVRVSPASLNFTTDNWGSAQTVTVTGVEDFDATDGAAQINLSASGASEYASQTARVAVEIEDDDIPAVKVRIFTLRIGEGGVGLFTVKLHTEPTAPVTVAVFIADSTVASPSPASMTFTADNWNTVQNVVVSGVEDDDVDDETTTISLTASGGDYQGLTASVDVHVSDDDVAGFTFSSTTALVHEGLTGSFTVRLNTQPSGDVTVSLSNSNASALTLQTSSLTFTSANWDTPQTVSLLGVQDSDSVNAQASISLSASGGGYSDISTSVSVTVVDDEAAGMVLSASKIEVTEGSSGSFTVRLRTLPTANVTLTVTSGLTAAQPTPSSLVFTADNWNTPQTVTVRALEDSDSLDHDAHIQLAASGGSYEGLATHVIAAIEDNDTVGLTLSSSSLTLTEGSYNNLTVSLNTQPSTDVRVTVASNSPVVSVSQGILRFTRDDWQRQYVIKVTGAYDADAAHNSSRLTLTGFGGDYEGVVQTASVLVTDTDSADILVTPASLTVHEGGSADFEVRLSALPRVENVIVTMSVDGSTNVSLPSVTFTPQNWNTPQSLHIQAPQDSDQLSSDTTLRLRGDGGLYHNLLKSIPVRVIDDDVPGLKVWQASRTVNENSTGSFKLSLNSQPESDVTVAIASSSTALSVASSSLTFTPGNWNTARTVNFTANHDDDANDGSATITLTPSGSGDVGVARNVLVTIYDDEEPGLDTGSQGPHVKKGSSSSVRFRLAVKPLGSVTISVSSANSLLAVRDTIFYFHPRNWDRWQTANFDSLGRPGDGETALGSIRFTGSGDSYEGFSKTVPVTIRENAPDIRLALSESVLSVKEGETTFFAVRLASRPESDVVVSMRSDQSYASLSATSLSFTRQNWSTRQNVWVTTPDDSATNGDRLAHISLSTGGSYAAPNRTVRVNVIDDEKPGLILSEDGMSFRPIAIIEGTTGYFTVKLATQPSDNVTVSLSSDFPAVAPSPTSLTFTAANWNVAQSFALNGVEDEDADRNYGAITLAASGGGYDDTSRRMTVWGYDNDEPQLIVSASSVQIVEGRQRSVTVYLNQAPPGDDMYVRVFSVKKKLSPPGFNFLYFNRNNWSTPQTFTFRALQDADAEEDSDAISFQAYNYNRKGSIQIPVRIIDDDRYDLKVSASQLAVGEGSSGQFTVRLASRPTNRVAVTLATPSADVQLSPSQLIFTSANWDIAQNITVRGVQDSDAVSESAQVRVQAVGGGYNNVTQTVSITVSDDDAAGLTLSSSTLSLTEGGAGTFSVRLNIQPDGDVVVDAASNNQKASATPGRLTFTRDNWNQPQSVTVTAVQDADTNHESAFIRLNSSSNPGIQATLSVSILDDDAPSLLLSKRELTLREGAFDTVRINLATRPTGDVTLVATSSNPEILHMGSKDLLHFTTSNWQTPQVLQIYSGQDHNTIDEILAVNLVTSGGGYSSLVESIAVAVIDNDTERLHLYRSYISLAEGGTAINNLVLNSMPEGDVTVTLTASDASKVRFTPSSLTFTTENWRKRQNFSVEALEDDDAVSERISVQYTAVGGGYDGIALSGTVALKDNDLAGIFASVYGVTVAKTGSASFGVKLQSKPTAAVTLTQSFDDATLATVSPTTLTFDATNWNVLQTLTVSGIQGGESASGTTTLRVSASGGDYSGLYRTFLVNVVDNSSSPSGDSEVLDGAGLTLSAGELTLDEGDTGTFAVQLDVEPLAEVTVTLSSSSDSLTAAPQQLTFTPENWDTPQDVTLEVGQDEDAVDAVATISLAAAGGGYDGVAAEVSVQLIDDESAGLELSAEALKLIEGADAEFAVSLLSQPTTEVIVAVSSGDGGAASVSPNRLTFTAENWSTGQTVTLLALDDADYDDETVDIRLQAAGGEYEGLTASLTLTIADDEALALARAERVAAQHALAEMARAVLSSSNEIIGRRFDASPAQRTLTVGGREVALGEPDDGRDPAARLAAYRLREVQEDQNRQLAGAERYADDWFGLDRMDGDWLGGVALKEGRPVFAEQAATAASLNLPFITSFSYAMDDDADSHLAGRTLWGRHDQRRFNGAISGAFSYDGSQDSIWLGFDQRTPNRSLFGLALGQSGGESRYTVLGRESALDTRLTTLLPYMDLKLGSGSVYMMLGLGSGSVDSLDSAGRRGRTEMAFEMASLGGNWPLARLGSVELSAIGSAGTSRFETEGGEAAAVADLDVAVRQLRAGIELSHAGFGEGDAGVAAPGDFAAGRLRGRNLRNRGGADRRRKPVLPRAAPEPRHHAAVAGRAHRRRPAGMGRDA